MYSKDDILSNLEEAIAVEESIQEKGKKETEQLGEFYRVKGALLEFNENYTEARKFFTKSIQIYKNYGQLKIAKDLENHLSEMERFAADAQLQIQNESK